MSQPEIKEFNKKEYYVSNVELYKAYVDWFASIESAKLAEKSEPEIPRYIADCMFKIARRLTYNYRFIRYTYHDDMVSDALYDCVRFAKGFNPEKILHKITVRDVEGKIQLKDIVKGTTTGYTGTIKYISGKNDNISVNMNQGFDFDVDEKIVSDNWTAYVNSIATKTADNPFSYITTICFNAFLRRIEKEKEETYTRALMVSDMDMSEFLECVEGDAEFKNDYIQFLREVGSADTHTPMAVKRKKRKSEEDAMNTSEYSYFSEILNDDIISDIVELS